MDERNSDRFPTVSFCFGFKPEIKDVEIMIMRNIANWQEHKSLQAMNSTFRKMTFDLKEVVLGLSYWIDGTFKTNVDLKVGIQNLKNTIVEIIEVYSERGRCYSFYSNALIASNIVLKFEFNICR
jgi:hypothetical protein